MCLNAGKFYEVTNSIMFCSSLSNCNHACLGILGLSITQQLFFRYTDFFLEKTVNDVILFLSTSISRENLNVSKIPVINFFSFVYSYETSLGKYIYIYILYETITKVNMLFLNNLL